IALAEHRDQARLERDPTPKRDAAVTRRSVDANGIARSRRTETRSWRSWRPGRTCAVTVGSGGRSPDAGPEGADLLERVASHGLRQAAEEDLAVAAGPDARIEDRDDASIAPGSDQPAEPLLERERGGWNEVAREGRLARLL